MMPSPYQPNPQFAAWCARLDDWAPQHHTVNPIPASLERYLCEDPDALTGTARGIMAEMEFGPATVLAVREQLTPEEAALSEQDDEPVIAPEDRQMPTWVAWFIVAMIFGVCCALAYGCHEMSALHHWAWIDGGGK